jgi:hypothetical protein
MYSKELFQSSFFSTFKLISMQKVFYEYITIFTMEYLPEIPKSYSG